MTNVQYRYNDIRNGKMVTEKNVKKLIALMRRQRNITSKEILTLLSMTGKCLAELSPKERVVLTKDVWAKLKKRGVELQTVHYNKLMSVFIENEYLFSPEEILGEMHKMGVSANKQTYHLMIDCSCEAGDLVGASMIAKMRKGELSEADEIRTFHSIIKGCFRLNQIDEALEIIKALRKQNRGYLFADTYILLMKLYAEKGDIESLKQIKHEAETKAGFSFFDSALFELLDGMRRFNQLHHVDLVMELCSNWLRGISPQLFANLYSQLECRGHDEAALKLLSTANKSFYLINDAIMQRLLKIPIKRKWPVEDVEALLQNFYSRDLPTDLCVPVFAACTYKDPDYALEILDYMAEKGYQLKAHYFYPLVYCYKDKDDMDRVLKMLQRLQNTVDSKSVNVTFHILRTVLDKKRKHTNLQSLLAEYGIYLDNGAVTKNKNVSQLLDLINQNKLGEAVKFFESIPKLKHVDQKVKEFLIKKCIKEKNYPLLEQVLKPLVDQKQILFCGIDMNKSDVLEESSPTCQKILTTELEKVLQTYNKTELQSALSHAHGSTMHRLIQTYLFLKSDSVTEAEQFIPESELNNFPKAIVRHKAILYLNENQVEKAMDCVRDMHDESVGPKCCPDHRILSSYRSLEDLHNYLTKANVTRPLIDQTILGQWIRCLCNSGTPDEVYPIVETFVHTYGFEPVLFRDFLLGYISRNDASMALESYKIIIDTQMKTTTGSHYVLEFLNTNNHEKEMADAFDACLEMLGQRIASFSLFYAKAFKDISSPKYEKFAFKPELYNSNLLKSLYSTLLEDRQYDQFERFLEYASSQFRSGPFTQSLLFHYYVTNKFDKAYQLLNTVAVDCSLKKELQHLFMKTLTRNRDFGLNVPKVSEQKKHQIKEMMQKIKGMEEAEDAVKDILVTEELDKLQFIK